MSAMAKNDPILIRLGDNLREKRTKLGISQEELAERCDLDRTYVSLVERGRRNPSFTNLRKLATGLESTVTELTRGL